MASEDRFGYEWNKYNSITGVYEGQFLNWVSPLTAKDFENKDVLDAGCGMGRNSYWPLKYGARHVTAFDADNRSLDAARVNLKQFSNAEIVFRSIYDIDWNSKFDIAMSIGVIHHLKDPVLAVKNLARALKPGGTFVVWVYSYEGNEWIVKYVDPVRKNITSKLPVGLVHALSYFCSIPLWAFVKIFKGPSPYLKQLSGYKLRIIHSIVFDQLIPEVANYWTKEQATELLHSTGLQEMEVHAPPNKSGWILMGKK